MEIDLPNVNAALNALCLALIYLCLRSVKDAHTSLGVVRKRTAKIRNEQREVKSALKETCRAMNGHNGNSPHAKPCDKPPEDKPS